MVRKRGCGAGANSPFPIRAHANLRPQLSTLSHLVVNFIALLELKCKAIMRMKFSPMFTCFDVLILKTINLQHPVRGDIWSLGINPLILMQQLLC